MNHHSEALLTVSNILGVVAKTKICSDFRTFFANLFGKVFDLF